MFVIIWSVLAVACAVYGIIAASVRSGNGFFAVWIGLAVLFAFFAAAAGFGLWQRLPGWLRIVFLIIAAAVLVCFVIVECLIAGKFHEKGREDLDYIIVLGAQVHESGPSAVLKYRLDAAAEYLKENPDTVCIVSGGQGSNEPFAEAEGMARYLTASGIPAERIRKEDRALSTEDNISFSMAMMEPDSSAGLVTNNFHMFRALQIAEKQGLKDVCGISAGSTPLFLPNNMLREFFAEIKFLLPF